MSKGRSLLILTLINGRQKYKRKIWRSKEKCYLRSGKRWILSAVSKTLFLSTPVKLLVLSEDL
jgi:hypothetical protein